MAHNPSWTDNFVSLARAPQACGPGVPASCPLRPSWHCAKLVIPHGLAALALTLASQAAIYEPTRVIPPEPAREFRGAWVATVANIDWPSQKALSTQEQKAELVAILDRAVQLKLNVLIFQVRPACDALYASRIEPWSEYLTGTMGKPPEPFYDPLAFAVEEAHKRGLELHAWFNPFRARLLTAKSPAATNHISKARPQLVRQYGEFLWLDPGERGGPGLLAQRSHGRGEALRRGWHPLRRLLLPLPEASQFRQGIWISPTTQAGAVSGPAGS